MTLHVTLVRAASIAAMSLSLLGACGSGPGQAAAAAAPPPPAPPPPPPVIRTHTLKGEVLAFDTGMLADASVYVLVLLERGPGILDRWRGYGPLTTDALGRFEITGLPDAPMVLVQAAREGYVQPCAATAPLTQDVEMRVELVRAAALQASPPARPQLGGEPSVTGIIYEMTPAGRQPVVDALIIAETGNSIDWDVVMATTRSEPAGGFYLCNLGRDAHIGAVKSGYETRWITFIDATEPKFVDIELRRIPGG